MSTTVNPTTWQGKRVLVTGHTGFKGTWLCSWLTLMGAEVAGFSLAPDPSTQTLYPASELDRALHSEIADLRDLERLRSLFDSFQPEVVFHLAAQALVRESYTNPVETFATNVMGTVNLLECCRTSQSVRSVVVVTSDKCYENKNWVWAYRENDRLGGHDPYSNSKACAELVTSSFRDSFLAAQGKLVATARAGNVIGGGDYAADRLVPDAVRAFKAGVPLEIRSPHATRPWQHVLEPVGGYLVLGQRLIEGDEGAAGPFNFGPESEESVGTVVEMLVEQWGEGATYDAPPQTELPHEAGRLHVSSDKARTFLRWRPVWDLAETVRRTVGFYKNWDGGSARELLLRDIREYCGI